MSRQSLGLQVKAHLLQATGAQMCALTPATCTLPKINFSHWEALSTAILDLRLLVLLLTCQLLLAIPRQVKSY